MGQDEQAQGLGKPSAQDTGNAQVHDELAVQFADLARDLEQSDDPKRTLGQIVQAAVQMVPGTDEGSISAVLGRRRVASEAPSGELAAAGEALQDQVGQGPCLDAVY